MKLQKAAEVSCKKENIKNCGGFIVLQQQLAIFSSSWNKQVILDSHLTEIFWLHKWSFIDQAQGQDG